MPNPSNAVTPAPSISSLRADRAPAKPAGRLRVALLIALAAAGPVAIGQAAPVLSPPTVLSMAELRPALTQVQNAITAVNIARWKVPGDIRANAEQDVTSMQKDLATTLPGLMAAADSAAGTSPVTLAPAFAVFRNLDALYDVLLRVSETAGVGASATDANNLEAARAALENGRGKLGESLLKGIGTQDAQVAHAAAAAACPTAPPPAAKKIVVEDGPENPKPRKRKATPPQAPQ